MRNEVSPEINVHAHHIHQLLDRTRRVSIRNILFATDLSPTADHALPYAVEMARRYGAKIYAVHAVGPDVYMYAPAAVWPTLAQEEEEFRQEAKLRLERDFQGLAHEIIFRPGDAWEILDQMIRANQIDLLVIGTHGRSGIEKVLLGSVVAKVFREALCPVLTVGPHVGKGPRPTAEFNRIVYATNFSLESLSAAPFAISLAREHRAQLIFLNCVEDGANVQVMLDTLRDLVPFGTDLRCTPICVAERGPHGEKILEVAEGHGADLIVLGVTPEKARLAEKGHSRRSALYHVVTQATCPVLTVRV